MPKITEEELTDKLLKNLKMIDAKTATLIIDKKFLRYFPSRKQQAQEFVSNLLKRLVKENENE